MRRVHDCSNLKLLAADAARAALPEKDAFPEAKGAGNRAGSIRLPIVEDHLGVALIQPGRRRYRPNEVQEKFLNKGGTANEYRPFW